jgi:hypothetical protein
MHFAMGAVLHTLVVAVLAFFVLFAAIKADGFVKLLGTLLGWILLLGAVLGLAAGLYGAATGHHPDWMEHGHDMMMKWHDEGREGGGGVPAPTTPPPAAKAAAPAAPSSSGQMAPAAKPKK